MNTPTFIALLALGVSILGYLDEKEHREWMRSREHS